jgi:hypothetical protein
VSGDDGMGGQAGREAALLPVLAELTRHHRRACPPYDRILAALGVPADRPWPSIAELPWLPVGLFKRHALKSIPDEEVFRVLSSSGTTGAEPARIYLDRATAAAQGRALASAMAPVLGSKRLPMLIVDSAAVTRSGSARGAGVLGMATFGRDHVYALDADGRPDAAAVASFLTRHGGGPFLTFGFTFMVWLYLYELAVEHCFDLSNGVLIHSGGWKRLEERSVDNATLRRRFAEDTGLTRIHNYYGMVEQLGSVFVEGPSGDGLYCPDAADVVIRDPLTWASQPTGAPGLIEVVSILPRSYPGHVLLTDDVGVVDGVDDGDRPGKRFRVLGRLPRAEPRGCSDTYAEPARR